MNLVTFVERSDSRDFLKSLCSQDGYLADFYLFKVNNGYTRTMREICSKLI